MKKILMISAISAAALMVVLASCQEHHLCPTYRDSGAKWKNNHGHPYGGSHKR